MISVAIRICIHIHIRNPFRIRSHIRNQSIAIFVGISVESGLFASLQQLKLLPRFRPCISLGAMEHTLEF